MRLDPPTGFVDPGSTMEVQVGFVPFLLRQATYEARVILESNDADEGTLVIPVTMTVNEPEIVVTPGSYNLTLDQGEFAYRNLRVTNLGEGDLSFETAFIDADSSIVERQSSPAVRALDVLVVDALPPPNPLLDMLSRYPQIGVVDYFYGKNKTPTLIHLWLYDGVVVASQSDWDDDVAMGDVLADYVDGGENVLQMSWTYGAVGGAGLQGRWVEEGYSPFLLSSRLILFPWYLGEHNATHPIMDGVQNLSASAHFFLKLSPDAQRVADWDSGEPIVATRETQRAARIVAVNVHPATFWWDGDLPLLVHNGVFWAAARSRIAWIDVDQPSGSIALGEYGILRVAIDAGDLQPGQHNTNIHVVNDDPENNMVLVPVSLTVVEPTCNGLSTTLLGTAGPGFIVGTPGDDVIISLGGNDVIWGKGGDDTICSGRGADAVKAGPGADWVSGGPGSDAIDGGGDDDRWLAGDDGADFVQGGDGNDHLFGGSGG